MHLECFKKYRIRWDNNPFTGNMYVCIFFTHLCIEFKSTSLQEEPAIHLHDVTQILYFPGYRTEYIRD